MNNYRQSKTKLILLLCFVFFAHVISAATESVKPKISATVGDTLAPSTPILIAPENGSLINTSTPTFVWQTSTDLNGIGHYKLFLDGAILFDNIPIVDTDNASYTLTFDPITTYYSLVPKSPISDGTHTWKIRAVDNFSNFADSVTWSFTIDSLAPSFILIKIGNITVAISAQDLSTIPSSPIELDDNEPLLLATSEADSNVDLTLTIPGDPTQFFSTTVDSLGNWSEQFGILPRDLVMTLDFVITDLAGNISVLSGVEFIIPSIVIFPPASPSPSASATATPEASATASPSASAPAPIEITVIPPREVIFNIIQETIERLPEPIKAIIAAVPEGVKENIRAVTPISAVVVATAIPALSFLALLLQFAGQFSPQLLLRILQAIGLIPVGKPQGIVFNSQTHEPVAFALLTITSHGIEISSPLLETVVTDVSGVYKGVKLPPGEYRIDVRHQDFRFPTGQVRPSYLSFQDFYKGEVFAIAGQEEPPLFLIPIDPLQKELKASLRTRLRIFLSRINRRLSVLVLPLFVLSGILTILYPTIWNWIVFALYTVVIVRKAIKWFKVPTVTGSVVDKEGQPLPGAIVRLRLPDVNQLVAVLTTDKKGKFAISLPRVLYHLTIIKPGFIWTEGGAANIYQIDTSQGPQKITATMESAQGVYEELMGTA